LFSSGAALACARLNIPYVITVDADILLERAISDQPLRGFHRSMAAWEARLTYRLARKVICVSEPAREHFVNTWGVPEDKIAVIPNGVDLELFGKTRSDKLIRAKFSLKDEPVIVFVGGFQPWHGLDFLVDCFSMVLVEVPQAKLFLVGDGPVRQEIERKIESLGMRSAVFLSGAVPQSEVPDYLAAADIAVLPYPQLPRELWFSPLKLYEYMASGKAIVATRSGQVAEVLEDQRSGVLVETGDERSFIRALVRLLESPEERERLGRNARRQAEECHSWGRQTQRLEAVYQEVLGKPGN
jgi:glycosyltransferase involved in cell wall biosynthesis